MKKETNIKKEILEVYKKLNIDTKKAEKNLKNKSFFNFNKNYSILLSNTTVKKQTQ